MGHHSGAGTFAKGGAAPAVAPPLLTTVLPARAHCPTLAHLSVWLTGRECKGYGQGRPRMGPHWSQIYCEGEAGWTR